MKNYKKGNGAVGLVVFIAIVWVVYSLFSGGKSDDSSNSSNYNSASVYSSYGDDDIYSDSENYGEPENPYDEGSGHSAGYEWAQDNDVDSCGGNSDSFIEHCEEYLSQQEEYEDQY